MVGPRASSIPGKMRPGNGRTEARNSGSEDLEVLKPERLSVTGTQRLYLVVIRHAQFDPRRLIQGFRSPPAFMLLPCSAAHKCGVSAEQHLGMQEIRRILRLTAAAFCLSTQVGDSPANHEIHIAHSSRLRIQDARDGLTPSSLAYLPSLVRSRRSLTAMHIGRTVPRFSSSLDSI